MPFIHHTVFEEYYDGYSYGMSVHSYNALTYVPGKHVTQLQKDGAKWTSDYRDHRWLHDSFVPPLAHFLWIVPLHAWLAFTLVLFAQVHTDASKIWLGIVAAAGAGAVALFWKHLYFNACVLLLKRAHPAKYHEGAFGMLKLQFQDAEKFSRWLREQLEPRAQYFGRVQPLVDKYLEITRDGQSLIATYDWHHPQWRPLHDKLEQAAATAADTIRPIYVEATGAEHWAAQEQAARSTAIANFEKTEDDRIEAQRVAMISDDIDTYVQGQGSIAP